MRRSAARTIRVAVRQGDRLPAGSFAPAQAKALSRLFTDDDPGVRAEAGRGLVDLGELAPVVQALAAGRICDWDLSAPLLPVLNLLAQALVQAPEGPRAELARVLVRSEPGRAQLRSRLPVPSAGWDLPCASCGEVIDTLRTVPALWPVQSPDGRWSVVPETPQLVFGEPADGVSLGRQSAAGDSGRAYAARDLAELAALQSDGLWFVCPIEPASYCRAEVVVDEVEQVADPAGWGRPRTMHRASYPDGHTREIAFREFLE